MLIGKKIIGTIGYMGGVMALPSPFVWSWTQMIEYNNDYLLEPNQQILYTKSDNSYHAFARNNLVKQIRGDFLLMLDTDHQFEPDLAARMLYIMNEANIDVLVGIYQYKGKPYSPKIYHWSKDGKAIEAIGDWDKPKGRYLIPIGSAGAGCLLVKKSVYEKIKEKLKEDPFDIIHPFSEDNSFFIRLKKLGIKAYCDPSIEYHHLEYRALSLKDYKKDTLDLKKHDII